MDQDPDELVRELNAIPEYVRLFRNVFSKDGEGKVLVFARSYNILRIMSGLCGLAFVN